VINYQSASVLGVRTVVCQMLPNWGLPDVSVVKGGVTISQ
jgi:hypothetical protein